MLVYIAAPYTKGDIAINVHNAFKIAEEVVMAGHTPYVPHWTHFWHLVFPHPHEYWMAIDREILKRCDMGLRMPGESAGADEECKFAREYNIPVIPLSLWRSLNNE